MVCLVHDVGQPASPGNVAATVRESHKGDGEPGDHDDDKHRDEHGEHRRHLPRRSRTHHLRNAGTCTGVPERLTISANGTEIAYPRIGASGSVSFASTEADQLVRHTTLSGLTRTTTRTASGRCSLNSAAPRYFLASALINSRPPCSVTSTRPRTSR